MKQLILIGTISLLLSDCKGFDRNQSIETLPRIEIKYDTGKHLATTLDISKLKYIHSFVGKDNKLLGKLYGKQIDTDLYSDFIITTETGKASNTIYAVEKTRFINTNGIEKVPMVNNDFYGYRILSLEKNSITLQPFWNDSKEVATSDPLTFGWDEEEEVFKVWLTP